MPRKPTLSEMLGNPFAQSAIRQLAQGIDPRLVAAQVAGDALRDHLAQRLGAPDSGPAKSSRAKGEEVVDAEFVVIDVTPKKKGK